MFIYKRATKGIYSRLKYLHINNYEYSYSTNNKFLYLSMNVQ